MFRWDEDNQQIAGMDGIAFGAYMVGVFLASILLRRFHLFIVLHILGSMVVGAPFAGVIIFVVHRVALFLFIIGRLNGEKSPRS
jgi:hypothetical protein